MYQDASLVSYFFEHKICLTEIEAMYQKCFFFLHHFTDQPFVASMPHFSNTPGPWDKYLEGLQPNATIHQSYSIIEPTLGVPLNQKAVSQCNIYLKDLSGFKSDFAKFSNKVIPTFWLEYVR
jgi:CD36 family